MERHTGRLQLDITFHHITAFACGFPLSPLHLFPSFPHIPRSDSWFIKVTYSSSTWVDTVGPCWKAYTKTKIVSLNPKISNAGSCSEHYIGRGIPIEERKESKAGYFCCLRHGAPAASNDSFLWPPQWRLGQTAQQWPLVPFHPNFGQLASHSFKWGGGLSLLSCVKRCWWRWQWFWGPNLNFPPGYWIRQSVPWTGSLIFAFVSLQNTMYSISAILLRTELQLFFLGWGKTVVFNMLDRTDHSIYTVSNVSNWRNQARLSIYVRPIHPCNTYFSLSVMASLFY